MEDGYISIQFKTNLSNAFFDNEEDTDRFDKWLTDKLTDAGLFNYSPELNPTGLPGISKLQVLVDEFDYRHILYARVLVDDYAHTFDEIYDNTELLDYVEREVAPMLVEEFNKIISGISFPMSREGRDFSGMKFEYEEFYCVLGYSENYGYFPSGRIQSATLVIEDDFEVYV